MHIIILRFRKQTSRYLNFIPAHRDCTSCTRAQISAKETGNVIATTKVSLTKHSIKAEPHLHIVYMLSRSPSTPYSNFNFVLSLGHLLATLTCEQKPPLDLRKALPEHKSLNHIRTQESESEAKQHHQQTVEH